MDSNFTARYHGHVSSLIVRTSGFLRQNAKMVGRDVMTMTSICSKLTVQKTDVYSRPCQTSMVERIDVWQGPKYASGQQWWPH